jgi:diguanylate cyclase (GGDEF)-like protein
MPRDRELKTRPIGDWRKAEDSGGDAGGGEPPVDEATDRGAIRDRLGGTGWDLAAEISDVILVGWPEVIAARLTGVVREVSPGASVRRAGKSRLRFSPVLPVGTLLILPEGLEDESGLDFLRRLRALGIEAPAILLGESEPAAPDDLEALGAVDLQPLDAFSPFSFRRALRTFGDVAVQRRLLAEMSSRAHAYERVLESKDDERLRVLQVASALERRLAETEKKLARLESSADRWQHPRLELGDLEDGEEPFAESQVRPPDGGLAPARRAAESSPAGPSAAPPAAEERVQQLESELTAMRDERAHQDAQLAELRQHGTARERELRRLVAQSATAGDLATRLEASERIRQAQTREMLDQQQLIAELEQKIENLAELLDARHQSETVDPGEVLAELESRLAQFEKIREQQQVTINQLSRTLAVQQVDDALDDARSRRNVLQRVEEAVRRSRRSGTPLTCLMIAIDHPQAIRDEHGSVLYDYLLVQVAQRLQVALRHRDVLLRYGDEAFVLLTDAESGERARPHAERLMSSVCDELLDLGPRRIRPSVSIAILHHRPEMSGVGELLRVTMKRLLGAQEEGERQIVVGPEPEDDGFAEETFDLEDIHD